MRRATKIRQCNELRQRLETEMEDESEFRKKYTMNKHPLDDVTLTWIRDQMKEPSELNYLRKLKYGELRHIDKLLVTISAGDLYSYV